MARLPYFSMSPAQQDAEGKLLIQAVGELADELSMSPTDVLCDAVRLGVGERMDAIERTAGERGLRLVWSRPEQ